MTPRRASPQLFRLLVVVVPALLILFACGDRSPGTPTSASTVASPQPVVAPNPPGVSWNGNITVESVTGSTTDCMPFFWNQGFAQPMSVTFMEATGRNGQPLLYLSQPVSVEACKLEYHETSVGIEAKAYYSDVMNDASDCHFRVISAGCRGQVWLLDPRLNAVFTDATRTRLSGSLEMPYDVSASNGGGWIRVTLVKRFEITKTSP